jgi:hypothetical protein
LTKAGDSLSTQVIAFSVFVRDTSSAEIFACREVSVARGLTFKVECESCGRSNSVVPNGLENDRLSCPSCGEPLGTVGELHDEFVRQIQSIMTDGLEARLKEMLCPDQELPLAS